MGPTNKELSIIMKLRDEVTKRINTISGKVRTQMNKMAKSMRQNWLAVTAAIAAAVLVLRKMARELVRVGKDLINVSAKFEKWQIQMEAFAKTAVLAKAKLKELIDFSIKTPFTPEEVLDVSALLLPLEAAGHKLKDLLIMSGNIAASYPMTFREAALNLNKSLSAGMGSARLFYEQGVRSHMQSISGITDLTKVSQQQLAEIFHDIYVSAASPLSRGIRKLSKTYEGLMSTLQGEWMLFQQLVGAPMFEDIKKDLKAVLEWITKNKEEGGRYNKAVEELGKFFKTAYKNAKDFFVTSVIFGGQLVDIWNEMSLYIHRSYDGYLKISRLQGKAALGTLGKLPWLKKDAEDMKKDLAMIEGEIFRVQEIIDEKQTKANRDYSEKMRALMLEVKEILSQGGQEIAEVMAGVNGNIKEELDESAEEAKEKWKEISGELKKNIKSITGVFTSGFGNAIADMIVEGKSFGESMKEVFKDMAKEFIAAVVKMMAQWLAFIALKSIGKMLGISFHEGGQVMHAGGLIRAHNGLAVDEVPIIAQRGEGILSRRGMAALGGAGHLNALNAGRGGGGDTIINIGPVYMQPGSDVREFANELDSLRRRELRYHRLT